MTTFTTQDREDAERQPMNANEMADELAKVPIEIFGKVRMVDVRVMLRQQQAEIEALKKFLNETCQTGKFIVWNSIKDKAQEK